LISGGGGVCLTECWCLAEKDRRGALMSNRMLSGGRRDAPGVLMSHRMLSGGKRDMRGVLMSNRILAPVSQDYCIGLKLEGNVCPTE